MNRVTHTARQSQTKNTTKDKFSASTVLNRVPL